MTCGNFQKWSIVDIDVDLAWGLDLHRYWVNKTTNSKVLTYYSHF